jgi:hypothetical protein
MHKVTAQSAHKVPQKCTQFERTHCTKYSPRRGVLSAGALSAGSLVQYGRCPGPSQGLGRGYESTAKKR